MTATLGFDETVAKAKVGQATTGEVLVALLSAQLLVASAEDYDPNLPLQPLSLTLDGQTFMVVFTDFDHMKNFQGIAKSAATLSGKDVVVGITDPTVGLLVNPGTISGYQIDANVITNLATYANSVSAGG
jgi:hypothetical protein